ncbi:hypothetical protein [Aquabacter cavernae]|uniref:hypothetical protein n=1 Tax=Aquabacter cavernae TaxID=2496029 RepID=UPI000F8E0A25|nr:hypothetical protein [Aquabacter cavernae]
MSAPFHAPPGAALRCLIVEAEPDTNALLRVLEPFVIHNVLPVRMDTECPDGAECLRVAIHFAAPDDLAARLEARLATMVTVRAAHLLSIALADRTATEAA